MEFSDLHVFPEGHAPSPYGLPVEIIRVGVGVLPPGLRLCAIGWIEAPPVRTGAVPVECVDALVTAYRTKTFRDGTRGGHVCGICGRGRVRLEWRDEAVDVYGGGHYLLRSHETVYMAPALLLHYICDHNYCPPREFLEATLHGRFLAEDDLVVTWDGPRQRGAWTPRV